ncbi:MAG TPA: hypothetical protein VGH89_26195 [Pseudonocardia sp.]
MRAATVTRFARTGKMDRPRRLGPHALIDSTRPDWLERTASALPAPELKRYTELVLAEATAGTVAPIIGQTFTLERAGAAHAAIEGRGVFGKTLLTMG